MLNVNNRKNQMLRFLLYAVLILSSGGCASNSLSSEDILAQHEIQTKSDELFYKYPECEIVRESEFSFVYLENRDWDLGKLSLIKMNPNTHEIKARFKIASQYSTILDHVLLTGIKGDNLLDFTLDASDVRYSSSFRFYVEDQNITEELSADGRPFIMLKADGIDLDADYGKNGRLADLRLKCSPYDSKMLSYDNEYVSDAESLLIHTEPKDAHVKILDVDQPFQQGMVLGGGTYDIEVSKQGYETLRKQIKIASSYGNIRNITMNLAKSIDRSYINDLVPSSQKILVSGKIVWKKGSLGFRKTMRLNGLLFTTESKKVNGWRAAIDYCNHLSFVENGVRFQGFRVPTKETLLDGLNAGLPIDKRGGGRILPASETDSNSGNSNWAPGVEVGYGSYSIGGDGSSLNIDSTSSVEVRCVSGQRKLSIIELANKLSKQESKDILQLRLKKAPKYIPYKTLVKGEFETTEQFRLRVEESNASIDKINKRKLSHWQAYAKITAIQHKKKLELFKDTAHQRQLNYLQQAMQIIYGKPMLDSISYDADREAFNIHITSERGGYSNDVTVSVKVKYARNFKKILEDPENEPVVEFEVVNNELRFSGIEQIKDPEYLVEEAIYKKSYNSAQRLESFINKYSESPFASKARARILVIEYEGAHNSIAKLKRYIDKYPQSPFISKANSRILVLKENKKREVARQKELKRQAALRDKEYARQRAESERREREAYLAKKHTGDKVCKEGRVALGLIGVTISAYVERVNGDSVQLRIASTEGQSINYNGTSLHQGSVIWDKYYEWKHCN